MACSSGNCRNDEKPKSSSSDDPEGSILLIPKLTIGAASFCEHCDVSGEHRGDGVAVMLDKPKPVLSFRESVA